MKALLKSRFAIYIWALMATSLWSCKDDSSVFEKTPDQRVNEALEGYQKELSGAEYGWKGVIYPGAGGSYSFYFKFNDQNRVVMYSDFDDESAVKSKESSYRLKAMQNPSLIFDTYSYLHILADPDGNVNGGNDGEGLQSDFEFSFLRDTTNNGTITLIGTKNRTRMILTKATQVEATAYGTGGLAKSLLFGNIAKYLTYFKRITIGGTVYEIAVNQTMRTITLSWLSGTTVNSFTTDYYYGSTGVVFVTPFTNGSLTLNGFSDIVWDANTTTLSVTAGGTKATIVEAARPLKVDTTAPTRWWQTAAADGGYWFSVNGFHVNGVDDAYKVNSLVSGTSPYYYYFY